jgi:hypothetical protein
MVTRDVDVYFQQLKTNNGPGAHSAQGSKSPAFLESLTLTTLNYKLIEREGGRGR